MIDVGVPMTLRKLVIFVAVLGALKLAHHEFLYRSSTSNVIIEAYRATALTACAKDARDQQLRASQEIWSRPASMKLVIGKDNLDVYMWQVNHAMWQARYKNPYLFIVARKSPNYILCEYDIVHNSASVQGS